MVIAVAVAEGTAIEFLLPALKLQFLRTVGEIVGRVARTDELVPAVGARCSGYMEASDAHARQGGCTFVRCG